MKIKFLQDILKDNEAFFVTSEVSRLYLTGFSSTDGYLVVKKNDACFFTDGRYIEDAEKKVVSCNSELFDGFDRIKKFLSDNVSTIFVENDYITISELEKYKNVFDNYIISEKNVLNSSLIEMRSKKSNVEIESLKKAQSIAEKAFYEILNYIKVGRTEIEVASYLEYCMRKNGGEKVSFETIVVSGKKSSVPHGVPTEKKICNGDFVTMDFGTVVDGYHSDMTRTVIVGKADETQKEIYETVLKAQNSAIDAIKSSVRCSDVDKAARDVIENSGYGKYFCHSTGHGVGLEIHENPAISPKSDKILLSGNVITIEPGIYLPGKFGVRIEDFGVVTQNGFINFTKADKHLIEINN